MAQLLLLPPHSPQLSPIEEAFSKVKVLLTKASPGTQSALVEEIMRVLSAASPKDAKGRSSHCGYDSEPQGS